ncbi:MAG: carbohydrate-binding domain-containing protein [Clostridia bacterium]|nr:carbohydrate-binding domain-containing protein [Clostridia bacterium]
MKKKIAAILISMLCIASVLTGCAVQQAGRGQTQTTSGTIGADATTRETATQQAAETDGQSELFTDRDLSAAYDEETYTVELTGTGAASASEKVSVSGSDVTITGAGTFILTGSLSDGSILVDADKEDKVQLVLSGVHISSADYAAVYVKQADKVFVTLADGTENTLSNGGAYTQRDDNDVDAVIFSKDDLTFNGTGTLTISASAGHGIVGKDDVKFAGGSYTVTAAEHAIRANDLIAVAAGMLSLQAGEDGLHAENSEDETRGNIRILDGEITVRCKDDAVHANTLLQIDGGNLDLKGAEGLEGTYVRINAGDIFISASDDGINAGRKSSAYVPTVEINGGEVTIVMGEGDTDGVDSNGNLIITGGTIDVTANSSFDYDGTAEYTGGVVIVNGKEVTSIPNQMMGGGKGRP